MCKFERKEETVLKEDELKHLHDRLDQLETLLQSLQKNQGPNYSITIDKAEFHAPVVDALNYHFDRLEVNEVSGALNLGNNFGVKVAQSKKASSSKGSDRPQKSEKEPSKKDPEKLTEQLINSTKPVQKASKTENRNMDLDSKTTQRNKFQSEPPPVEQNERQEVSEPPNSAWPDAGQPSQKSQFGSYRRPNSNVETRESKFNYKHSMDRSNFPFKITIKGRPS